MSSFTLIGIIFVTLKLTEIIDWHWFWVISPFLVGPVIALLALALTIAISSRGK